MDEKAVRKIVRDEIKKIKEKEYYSIEHFSQRKLIRRNKDGTYVFGKEMPLKRA